jgi:hypothetical protein
MRHRFWLATSLSIATFVLLVRVLVSHYWIEEAFGIDPDARSGALEWLVVAGLALATVGCILAARHEWRVRQPVVRR